MDPYQNNSKDNQSNVKSKDHVLFNHCEWFADNTNYRNEDEKSSYPNIFDINENAPNQHQDQIMQSASSVASNSLQNYVEEALRSVEDGVASLDHRELNIMVERQKESSEMPSSSSVSNNPYVTSSAVTLSSNLVQPSQSASITPENHSSGGLDLAQVVSEIFSDSIEPMEIENSMRQRCKSQKSFQVFHESGGTVEKRLESLVHESSGSLTHNNDSCLQNNSSLHTEISSSVPIPNPSRLVVSPSVLNKVLSKNTWFVPHDDCLPTEQVELDDTSPGMSATSSVLTNKFINLNCDRVDNKYVDHPIPRCLLQAGSQFYSPISHSKHFCLSSSDSLQSSSLLPSLYVNTSFKLPQQPLPRTSLTEFQEKTVPLTTKASSIKHLTTSSENTTKGNVQDRNYPTSNLSHPHSGINKFLKLIF
jgi:hypothetical protein